MRTACPKGSRTHRQLDEVLLQRTAGPYIGSGGAQPGARSGGAPTPISSALAGAETDAQRYTERAAVKVVRTRCRRLADIALSSLSVSGSFRSPFPRRRTNPTAPNGRNGSIATFGTRTSHFRSSPESRGSGPGQKRAFWPMWVVLIAGSTGSASAPSQASHHAGQAATRAGGAMNSGPTGSAIDVSRMRSISVIALASIRQPMTSATGAS